MLSSKNTDKAIAPDILDSLTQSLNPCPKMYTEKIWMSLVPTVRKCPKKVLQYNRESKLFWWDEKTLFRWFLVYFTICTSQGSLFILYLVFKMCYEPMTQPVFAIHVLLFLILGFGLVLASICVYTALGYSKGIGFLFNYLSYFFHHHFSKYLSKHVLD